MREMDPSAKPFVSANAQAYASGVLDLPDNYGIPANPSTGAATNGTTTTSSNPHQQSNVVRMRGLPYTASEDDIRAFVSGYRLEGDGDLTYRRGEAYLRMESGAEARRFVEEKNHGHVGERYVELQVSTAKALQEAKDRIVAASSVNPVIRMRGLPFTVSEEEVRAFFDDIFPSRDTVLSLRFGLDCDERRTGEAFLELATEEAAELSMTKTKGQLGGRFVDVARSSANERETVLLASSRRVRLINPPSKSNTSSRHHNHNNNNNGANRSGSNTNNNNSSSRESSNRPSAPVPLTTSPLIPQPRSGTNLMRGPRGSSAMSPLPAAMGYPPTDPAAAAAAMSLLQWNAMMALNTAMMMSAFPPAVGMGGAASLPGGNGGGGAQQQRTTSRYIVRVRGLPFSASEETVATFFEDVDIPPQGVHMVYNAQDKPTGEAFVEVSTEVDVQRALQHNGAALGHRYIEVFRSSAADMQRLSGGALPGEVPSPAGNLAAAGMPPMPMSVPQMMPGMFYSPMMLPTFF